MENYTLCQLPIKYSIDLADALTTYSEAKRDGGKK
jgi:hypothetical protein